MLSEQSFRIAAALIGCDVAAIKAVAEVEAPRGAFQADGRMNILFEPHIFWRELKKRGIDPNQYYILPGLREKIKNPEWSRILSPEWDSSLYGKYSEQWPKLEKAATINKDAAYASASYGMFQILGNNFKACEFDDLHQFIAFMQESEGNQLICFVRFVKSQGLADEIKRNDWAGFAKGYNGSGYKQNRYDAKLAAAYKKYTK